MNLTGGSHLQYIAVLSGAGSKAHSEHLPGPPQRVPEPQVESLTMGKFDKYLEQKW
jgi:hypothetical protein